MRLETPITRATCCAVIVTYEPDGGFSERLSRIAAQFGRVFVIDNASGAAAGRMLRATAARHASVELVRLDSNEGIATALNLGFGRASTAGFTWVASFDQDTLIIPELLPELAAIYAAHPQRGRIGVLAANFYEGAAEREVSSMWRETATVITSGAMTPIDVFRRIGPFRADYFIDSVDEEFCLRARKNGFLVVTSTRPLMHHEIGRRTTHRLFGVSFATSQHPPLRRYYMLRNRVLTLRAFARREPRWAASRAWLTFTELVLTPLVETEGRAKLKAMLAGLWDGSLGRVGAARRTF